jgi:hypothetical protein
MVELTEREKAITLIKYIIHGNSPYSEVPLETRVQMLEAALKTSGINYNQGELLDIGQAILDVQQAANDSALGFLQNNKGLVQQALNMIGKGNDRLSFRKANE